MNRLAEDVLWRVKKYSNKVLFGKDEDRQKRKRKIFRQVGICRTEAYFMYVEIKKVCSAGRGKDGEKDGRFFVEIYFLNRLVLYVRWRVKKMYFGGKGSS